MQDQDKTKDQLILELDEMRRRVTELEEKVRHETWRSIENSALKLLEMLDKSHQAYFLLRDGRVEFLNRACVEMFGYSELEWSSLPSLFEKVIHPDDRKMWRKYYKKRLQLYTSPHRYVCRIVCKDGTPKWLDIQSSSMMWKKKQAFLAVATDITEYIQLQKSLEEKTYGLNERVKEINCLYQISELMRVPDLSLPQLLQKIVDIIPLAWQYPEITCAEISVVNDEYRTSNHTACVFKQSEKIMANGADVGFVAVGYLEERPESDEGPFLSEERNLIKAIAEHIGQLILLKRSDEESRIRDKAIRTAINGIGFAYPDGRLFFVNDELLRMWRFKSQDEVIGKHISEFWVDPNSVSEGQLELLKKGRFLGERTALRGDGTTFEAQVSTNSVLDDSGKVVCMMASFLDVTDRKKAEEEIRDREQRFSAITDSVFDPIILLDDNAEICFWNTAAERIFGYSSSEAMRKNVHELLAPSSYHQAASSGFKDFTQTGRGNAIGKVSELIARRKNGEEFPIELSLSSFQMHGRWFASGIVRDISERKIVENKLRQNEKRFRSFIESAPDAIFVQTTGCFAYVNKASQELFGADSPDQLLGSQVSKFLHPSNSEIITERIHKLNVEKKPAPPKEEKFIRLDGSVIDVEVSAVPVRYQNEDGALVFARDLTERQRLNEALRQSEERFRQVSDNAEEWIWEVDENGLYTYCSSSVAKILGYSNDELVGKKYFYDFYLPEEREKIKEFAFGELVLKSSFSGFVTVNIRKDGVAAILDSSGIVIVDQNGKMIGYRGIAKDITERLRTEQERARLFTAIEQAAASVLITNPDGTIEYVNPAFEKITGYAPTEVIGKNPKLLQSGKHDKPFYEDLWKTISGGNVWTGRIINRRKDGSIVYEEGAISPVRDANGNIVNYVQVTQDVTKEVELQNQLVQAQKLEAIGTLAGGIAHDFNNILFAITGYTELAMLDLPPESRIRSNLERVMHAARRSGDMVKQILAFSRQGEAETTALDLRPLVKEGLKFLRAAIPSTIEISQRIEPELGKVLGDPTQIHQVLMNLCVNASHAIKDSKGTISVELSEVELDADFTTENPPLSPGKHLRLTVSDTGAGIPSEIMEKIFDPYFTTKEAGKGTGLGLSVVHGIVEKHKGAITITSELGKGSTFNVFLPVVEKEAPQAEENSTADITPTGKEHILVVDDESHLLEMYERQLKRLGYEVTCSNNPEDALELFQKDPGKFDLVITDFTMPNMTGIDLAKELGSILPGLPIILCSGVSQVVSDSVTKQAGIQTVIYKPIRRPEIAQAIRKALDQKP